MMRTGHSALSRPGAPAPARPLHRHRHRHPRDLTRPTPLSPPLLGSGADRRAARAHSVDASIAPKYHRCDASSRAEPATTSSRHFGKHAARAIYGHRRRERRRDRVVHRRRTQRQAPALASQAGAARRIGVDDPAATVLLRAGRTCLRRRSGLVAAASRMPGARWRRGSWSWSWSWW